MSSKSIRPRRFRQCVSRSTSLRCAKHGHRVCVWCVLNTVGFPMEHLLWEKAPGFVSITHLLGL